jgi:hypothetical protein
LSGGLLPEGVGFPDEEAVLIENRKDELCVATIESVEIGWSFLNLTSGVYNVGDDSRRSAQTAIRGHAGFVRDTRNTSSARSANGKQTSLGTGSTGLD